MFGLVGIGDRAGTGMTDAIAIAKEKLGAKVEYSVPLEPERTALSLEMNIETRDKIEKQGINKPKTRDKTSDKIEHLEGISQKTRDNLLKMVEYMQTHPIVKNHEIAELISVGDDRARVLLMLLVDNGLLPAEGEVYTMCNSVRRAYKRYSRKGGRYFE